MEVEEGINVKVAVRSDEAPEGWVAPKSDNHSQFNGPVMAATPAVMGADPGMEVMKKRGRGRPRKYDHDSNVSVALSPMPISVSIPFTGEFSGTKRSRGRPVDPFKKQHKFEFQSSGEGVAFSFGANFTPHIITVNAGEDVSTKITSFSQRGFRAICILSANGMISNVTIRQPNSSGGTLTYEGRFEILSLSGSFTPMENGGTENIFGRMSVSLAGTNGRVVGGGLAGMLIAAGPVQVVVGSFLQGHQQQEPKKKQKLEPNRSTVITYPTNCPSSEENNKSYCGLKLASFNNMPDLKYSSITNNKPSLPVEESNRTVQPNHEIYCS